MKILFLTSRLPFPPLGGDKVRTFHFIKHLSTKHDLTIVSFIENASELNCLGDFKQFYKKIVTIRLTNCQSYWNCLFGLVSGLPLQIHYYYSKKMRQVVADELDTGYDVIFCHLIRMAQYLPDKKGIHKIIDFTDAISLNYDRSRAFRQGLFSWINLIESNRVFKYEINAAQKADRSIFISDIDANYLNNNRGNSNIAVVNNGVDLNEFTFHNSGYNKKQIMFLGNMRTFPNTDAVVFFAKEVLPLLKAVEPQTCFYIIGIQPPAKVLKLHDGRNIVVTGYVADVRTYLKNSAVMAAPMRTGAGIQNKILESLAVGTPIVTTDIGAEGLDKSVLSIANTPVEISKAILNLMQNEELRKTMASRGRSYVETQFSWEKSFEKLDAILA